MVVTNYLLTGMILQVEKVSYVLLLAFKGDSLVVFREKNREKKY